MKGAVYSFVRLMPGSRALELYEAGKKKELDAHMEQIDAEYRKLSGRPKSKAQQHIEDLTHPCCLKERRGMGGGCLNCGDPCF